MLLKKTFPSALAVCLLLTLLAFNVSAQTQYTRPRQTSVAPATNGMTRLETEPEVDADALDPQIISLAETEAPRPSPFKMPASAMRFDQLLIAAIDTRIGAPYVWGAAGPTVFDCSGFVWSAFQSAGVRFERSSARSLWMQFAPARPEEEFKFGTLVFFNGQSHIGIVADAHGFYHASRSHGVTYSTFNDYWLSRVDGFRRVPASQQNLAE
jgi:cell wall-associated NlpC family hydrolase